MRRRHLPTFEFGDAVFQPSHALHQLVRMAKPNINRTSPLIKSPQQFCLGIADLFGQHIIDLPNSLGDILGSLSTNLPNGIGKILVDLLNGVCKILFGCWLTTHT